jgi:hypothetical protein
MSRYGYFFDGGSTHTAFENLFFETLDLARGAKVVVALQCDLNGTGAMIKTNGTVKSAMDICGIDISLDGWIFFRVYPWFGFICKFKWVKYKRWKGGYIII